MSKPGLIVKGCSDKAVADRIIGTYLPHGTNHNKVTYKKEKKAGRLDVYIFYWDERDGDDQCGWWFGPEVGGNQVWAYHPSRAATTPPGAEWNVPHDGDIDPTFTVQALKHAAAGEKPDVTPAQRAVAAAEERRKADVTKSLEKNVDQVATRASSEGTTKRNAKPEKTGEEVTSRRPRKASRCKCGEAFSLDCIFCRKCGSKREEVPIPQDLSNHDDTGRAAKRHRGEEDVGGRKSKAPETGGDGIESDSSEDESDRVEAKKSKSLSPLKYKERLPPRKERDSPLPSKTEGSKASESETGRAYYRDKLKKRQEQYATKGREYSKDVRRQKTTGKSSVGMRRGRAKMTEMTSEM